MVSVPILLLALIAAWFLMQKGKVSLKSPRSVFFFFLASIVLLAFPLLFIHPFFPASADVVHVTNIRILADNIPETYAPYSDLQFTYQIGFSLFSKMISDLLFFIPDYLVVWGLGILFSGLVLLFLFWTSRELTGSEKAALVSVVLVFGSKFVFTNFYFGVFPLLASFAFFFATLLFFEKKSFLALLFFPVTLIIHPFTGAILATVLLLQVLMQKSWHWGLLLLASVLLAIPAILRTYFTITSNFGGPLLGFNPALFVEGLTALFPWTGIIPFLLLILALLFGSRDPRANKLLGFTVLFAFLAVLFFSIELQHADKFFWIFSIFSILYSGTFFMGDFWKSIEKRFFQKISFGRVLTLIFLLCLVSFVLSSELSHGRSGSKLSVEEGQFAVAFKTFDPALKKTVFLSNGSGWMATIANKIPLDVRSGHFVPDSQLQVVDDTGWKDVLNREQLQKKIENGCRECILESKADYLVVNTNQFSAPTGFKKVFEYKKIIVYSVRG
ncbi:hypothetical protein KKE06_04395 [Candidatus Micrarchaeota archaeon]|nr:hypothetical protein [Candidatus Micrarchaeota archaeon]